MKNSGNSKLAALLLILAIFLISASAQAQKLGEIKDPNNPQQAEPKKPIGISFGLTYYSTYLWRGVSWFDGDGAFTPFISYDIAGSGLVFTILGELSASAVSTQQSGRNTNPNIYSYSRQGINFSLDYTIPLGKIAAIKLNALSFIYPISKEYSCNVNDNQDKIDQSGLTATAGIFFDGIPLKPNISYTHDFNVGNPRFRFTDFYIKIGIGQDFELAKDLTFTLGGYIGLFNNPSFNYRAEDAAKGSQFGISELAANANLAYKISGATISAMFTYINFPYPEKYEGATVNIHRYFATIAVSYTF